nr:von Willebrand factor, type A [Tanacetum cinerariifolium]
MDDFSRSVHAGLQFSKRISYGKNTAPPRTPSMTKTLSSSSSSLSLSDSSSSCSYYHPTSPMVYAVISDPSVVENPEICSYQPHVYGKCDPPALVPLHMHGVGLEVEGWLMDGGSVVVSLSGVWRVHCVASCATCDCRVVVPMGEQLTYGSQVLDCGVAVIVIESHHVSGSSTPFSVMNFHRKVTEKNSYVLHWLVLNASIAAVKYVTPAATCAARVGCSSERSRCLRELRNLEPRWFVVWSCIFKAPCTNIYSTNHGGDDVRQNVEIDAHVGGVNDLAFSHPNKQLCVITFGDDKTIEFIYSTALDGKIKAWLYDKIGSRVDYEAPGRCMVHNNGI